MYSIIEELPRSCPGQLITKRDLSQFNILRNIQSKRVVGLYHSCSSAVVQQEERSYHG